MSFNAFVGDDTLVREGSSQRWDLPAPLELSLSDSTRRDTSGERTVRGRRRLCRV